MRRWSKEDEKFLKDNINLKSNKEIAKYLEVDIRRVAKKISRLGLKRNYLGLYPPLEGEVWKKFPKNTNYEVSNMGRIRNALNNRVIKPWYSKSDYYYVDIGGKSLLAHRVVAETWLENSDESKIEVNHINGVKNDFRPSQLEWVTPSENNRHAWTIGLKTKKFGTDNPNSKLSESDVLIIRSSKLTSRKLGKFFGVDKKVILNIKNGVSYIKPCKYEVNIND